jgi:hypothetical protein
MSIVPIAGGRDPTEAWAALTMVLISAVKAATERSQTISFF